MSEELVSVVIPSYNYEKYLPPAVESVACQTYGNIELIMVDDASTDGSAAVVRALEKQYSGRFADIKVLLNEKNMGAHRAINKGVGMASGALVSVLNADDLYQPDRFAVMTAQMGGAGLAFSRVECIGAGGERLDSAQARRFEAVQERIAGQPFMALASLAENVAVSTGNMLFTKRLFTELGGFKNYRYVHDYDFFLNACLVTEPVFVTGTSYLYRLHGENSFTRLQRVGIRENRMVWLDIYGKVRRGEIGNPAITSHSGYTGMFEDAVAAEGSRKAALWRMSANPAVRAGLALLKCIYRV